MSSPRATGTRNSTTPLIASSSIQFEELDRLCGTPNSVASSFNVTTNIETKIEKAEGDLTSHLKQYATASHHLTLLQTNLNSGTVPKGLVPNIKVTAFMQNNEVDKAVQKYLTETSTKLVNILIAHYHAVKDQAKTNAMAVESKIKDATEQSSNQTEWTAKWKQSRSATENHTRKLACSYTNKRNGKISPNDTNQEVHNNTLIIEFNHSMITLNTHTEPTPPSTSEQLDMEKNQRKGRPVPERPIPRPRRVQRQRLEQTVQRQRPTKLNRQKNRTLNKKRHIYKRKYKHKHVITTSNNTDNILNLSTYTLTQHEMSILSKGLSFIPKIKSKYRRTYRRCHIL